MAPASRLLPFRQGGVRLCFREVLKQRLAVAGRILESDSNRLTRPVEARQQPDNPMGVRIINIEPEVERYTRQIPVRIASLYIETIEPRPAICAEVIELELRLLTKKQLEDVRRRRLPAIIRTDESRCFRVQVDTHFLQTTKVLNTE